MFLRKETTKSIKNYSAQIKKLKEVINTADAILVGAGAGMSVSAGFTYSGERFYKYFSDFSEKYGIEDMYSGGFYPFDSLEEYWAWWSRQIYINRYIAPVGEPYKSLLKIIRDKDYFVLTTNVDHQFQLAGFNKEKLFYTQGDYGLWQCSKACHQKTYDNKDIVEKMWNKQENMKIPTELIPYCPVCREPMTMNLRCDDTFIQDEGWYAANHRYMDFIKKHQNENILYLELGVGSNTPVIIKYPFWHMTAKNSKAKYACLNYGEAYCPKDIETQSICINNDISKILRDIEG